MDAPEMRIVDGHQSRLQHEWVYAAAQEPDVERGNNFEWPSFVHDRHSAGRHSAL